MTPSSTAHHAFLYGGHDPCVCCLGLRPGACGCWDIPIRPCGESREALALARELSHP